MSIAEHVVIPVFAFCVLSVVCEGRIHKRYRDVFGRLSAAFFFLFFVAPLVIIVIPGLMFGEGFITTGEDALACVIMLLLLWGPALVIYLSAYKKRGSANGLLLAGALFFEGMGLMWKVGLLISGGFLLLLLPTPAVHVFFFKDNK